jgi:nicotinamide-nucleotide amidase
MERPANTLLKQMRNKGLTLAIAESMTCGMAAAKLGNVSRTSDVLLGSVVCYTPEVKKHVLRIPSSVIKKHTCESREVTKLLAKNLHALIKADICVAITGLASKGGSETARKPVGTVFLSLYINNSSYNYRKVFRGSPHEIKKKTCKTLYELILKKI